MKGEVLAALSSLAASARRVLGWAQGRARVPVVGAQAAVVVVVPPCSYCAEDEGRCEFCGGAVPGRRCAYCAERVRAVIAAAIVG